jgi:hypothetical protein
MMQQKLSNSIKKIQKIVKKISAKSVFRPFSAVLKPLVVALSKVIGELDGLD